MVDMFRLNALVTELLGPGGDFDPDCALELFESLPDEGKGSAVIHYYSSTPGGTLSGLTNAGPATFQDKQEVSRTYGMKKGMWIGKFRVTRLGLDVQMAPRFSEPDEEPADSYVLRFGEDGTFTLLKTHYRVFRIWFPPWPSKRKLYFSWARGKLKPWKKARKPEQTPDALR